MAVPAQTGKTSVLVVEDDDHMRELMLETLTRGGYEVTLASDGDEALASAELAPPALAILDVNLPRISGYEVCAALRRCRPRTAIVFVSGERVEAFDRVAGLLLGADDYVVKPFAPDELLARVRSVLRRTIDWPAFAALTPRERDVLVLLADGLEQVEIAERLVISSKTVASHIERILAKLGVHSRAQAVAVAYREGLVPTSV